MRPQARLSSPLQPSWIGPSLSPVHSLFTSPLYQNLCNLSFSSNKSIACSLPTLVFQGLLFPFNFTELLLLSFLLTFLSSSRHLCVSLSRCPLHPSPEPRFLPLRPVSSATHRSAVSLLPALRALPVSLRGAELVP